MSELVILKDDFLDFYDKVSMCVRENLMQFVLRNFFLDK